MAAWSCSGPLSPLPPNVLLDEVDRALEACGHGVARYADDGNGHGRRCQTGERGLDGLRRRHDRRHLKVNEATTAFAPASGRTFLVFGFWYGPGGQVTCRVADQAKATYQQRIRPLTRRSGGRSLPEVVVERLRTDRPGWKGCFQLAQTPQVFRELDQWLRHRLRARQLMHWRRGATKYRALLALGASNSQRWWRNSCLALNRVMPIACFGRRAVPRLS